MKNSQQENRLGFLIWLLSLIRFVAPPAIADVQQITARRADPMTAVDESQAGGVQIRRDSSGRLRAPVLINGRGPFSLIVDTGANGSAVTAGVIDALGLSLDESSQVILHGVTGSSKVAAVKVDSLAVGAAMTSAATLPIVFDALDGADGYLGIGAFADKRVLIDFRRGRLEVSDSRPPANGRGYITVPADLSRSRLVTVDASVNGTKVKAIIDTGAGNTIGNSAMRNLLGGVQSLVQSDKIIGATAAVDLGQTYPMPPIVLGALRIAGAHVSFADVSIFNHFKFSQKPALLIGMDVLGQLDSMIIDYGAHELQLRPLRHLSAAPSG
jgi:predicted aspartyl protease